jgi:hypothetical protein
MNICKIAILNVDISVSIHPNVTVGRYHELKSIKHTECDPEAGRKKKK